MKNTLIKMLNIVELIERCDYDILTLEKTVEKFKENYPGLAQDREKKIYNRKEVRGYLQKRLQHLKTEL